MPRKTRAATKAANDEIHNDETATVTPEQTELQVVGDERPALAEITANEVEQLTLEINAEDKPPAKEKRNTKRKNTRKGTSGRKLGTVKASNAIDREIGEIALNVVEIPQCLTRSTQRSQSPSKDSVKNSISSPTPAESVSENSKENTPPASNDELTRHSYEVPVAEESKEEKNNLNLGASQAGQKLEELFQPQETTQEVLKEPSIAEILARSASKKFTKLQDPIEAMDADAERLDEVGKALSAIKGRGLASKKAGKDKVKARPSVATKPPPAAKSTFTAKKSSPLSSTATVPSSTSKSSEKPKSSFTTQLSIHEIPAKTIPTAQPKLTITALHPPVKVAKSSKPLTKSTFQLPGEAVAAKLKAQREERQKKKELEASNTLSMAKPTVPAAQPKPVEVRQTAASKARLSMIKGTVSAKSIVVSKERTSTFGTKRMSTVPTKNAFIDRLSTLPHRPKPIISGSPATNATNTANTGRPRSTLANQSTVRERNKTSRPTTVRSSESKMTQKQPARDRFNHSPTSNATQRRIVQQKENTMKKAQLVQKQSERPETFKPLVISAA